MILDASGLWELIDARAEATPDLPLAFDERGRSIDFGEYRRRVERVAAALAERGLAAGDRVSWQLPTWIETAILVGALARLGIIQNPLIPILREREVGFITERVRPSLIVAPTEWRGFAYGEMVGRVAGRAGAEVLLCDRALPESDPSRLAPPPPSEPRATRWILYTSGTSGPIRKGLCIATPPWPRDREASAGRFASSPATAGPW